MKKISIIIPMYNVARYIETCVASVVNQDIHSEFIEILLVDDESPDNSLELARQMAKENSSIKIFSQKNKGLGGARNTGIKNAVGEYLIFLDADDFLEPHSLNTIYEEAKSNDLDFLEFGVHIVSEDYKRLAKVAMRSKTKPYSGIEYYKQVETINSACNKLYSRQFLIHNNIEFLEKVYGEDFEFNTRVLYFAEKVNATPYIGISFLQSTNSITRNTSKSIKDKYLKDFVILLNNIKEFRLLHHHKISQNLSIEKFFNQRMALINVDAFYMLFKNGYAYGTMKDFKKELKKCNLYYLEHPVKNRKKELFRHVLYYAFFLFALKK